jgi:hypothetical protein
MEEHSVFYDSRKELNIESELVEMTPKEFIQKTMPGATISYIETYIDKNLAREYSIKMKQGEKFPTPYLIYCLNDIIHEGRHRAYAAKTLGIEKIPVIIIKSDSCMLELYK